MIFKFLKKSTAFSFNDSNFFFFNPVLLLVSSELRIQPIDWLGHPNTTSWKAVQENLTINISIILTSSHLLSLSPWCHHFKAIVLLILARNLWKLVEFSGLCESSHLSCSVSICIWWTKASLVAQVVKNLPAMQETWVQSLGREDPLEKGMETHSSILPGEFHEQRSLEGYSPQGHRESGTTDDKHFHFKPRLFLIKFRWKRGSTMGPMGERPQPSARETALFPPIPRWC